MRPLPLAPMLGSARVGARNAAAALARLTLALAGALPPLHAAQAAEAGTEVTVGAFSIEAVRQSARSLSMNTGFSTITYFEFSVRHQGRALRFVDAERRTVSTHREAWVLGCAPRPALLMGGGPWSLVTEDGGRPLVHRLADGRSGGSVQWLDTPAGFGPRIQSVLRQRVDDPRVLQGGRRLLLNDAVVLDVQTLQWPAQTTDPPPDYQAVGIDPLGLAPDGSALALLYTGPSHSLRDALLVVPVTSRAGQQLLPVDLRTQGNLPNAASASPAWLQRHSDWVPGPAGAMQLRPRLPPASAKAAGVSTTGQPA